MLCHRRKLQSFSIFIQTDECMYGWMYGWIDERIWKWCRGQSTGNVYRSSNVLFDLFVPAVPSAI